MNWTTECRQVRTRIPLLVGQDLPPAEIADVERHVRTCPECREHLTDCETSQAALLEVRAVRPEREARSVWPDLESRLPTIWSRPTRSRAGWIPVGALAAACAALVLVGLLGPSFDDARFLQPAISTGGQVDPGNVRRVSGHSMGGWRFSSPHYTDSTTS